MSVSICMENDCACEEVITSRRCVNCSYWNRGALVRPPPASPVVDERALFEQAMRELSTGEPDWKSAAAMWAWAAWQASAAVRRTTGKDQ